MEWVFATPIPALRMHAGTVFGVIGRLAVRRVVVFRHGGCGKSVRVGEAEGVLVGVEDVRNDFGEADVVFDLGEDVGAGAAHFFRVAFHDGEVCADGGGEVGFVDDEEVGLGDAGAAFARDFIAAGDVDDLDGVVGKFAAEAGGEIVTAGFEQEDVGAEFLMEIFEGEKIGGDVFADGGVRAATGFDGADAFGGEGFVADEKFAVFFGENVVRDGGDAEAVAEMAAELEHEGGFAAADGAAHADGEGALGEVAVEREIAIVEVTGVIQVFVGVAVIAV